MSRRNPEALSTESLSGVVCIIDGDQGVRESLCALLRTFQTEAIAFSTAEEFLEWLDGASPACLVVELTLPGMSGLELMASLEAKGRSLPAIGMTWRADSDLAQRAIRGGLLDVVEKPFVHWQIMDGVQNILRQFHPRHAVAQNPDPAR